MAPGMLNNPKRLIYFTDQYSMLTCCYQLQDNYEMYSSRLTITLFPKFSHNNNRCKNIIVTRMRKESA